ncbi:MAG: aminotransferase, partial [uncultured bacterium]
GQTYTAAELKSLYDICRSRGIYILMDEAYSDFVLDNSFCSLTNLVPSLDGIIVVNSLSKNMGMSGWRIGYAISSQPVLNELLKLNQHLITCASTILQQYLAKYFDDILSYTLSQVKTVVEKRNNIAKRMDEIGLRYLEGNTTFYFFVKTDPYRGNIHDLALYLLLEKNICVVPGSAYGETTERFLRISIGAESDERIDQALQLLYDFLNGSPIDSVQTHNELSCLGLPEFSASRVFTSVEDILVK